MTGKEDIQEIQQSAFCWREKANEIIKFCNVPWEVKVPDDDGRWGCPEVKYADNKVTIDLSGLTVVEFRGCDDDGNEFKFTCFGFKEAVEE